MAKDDILKQLNKNEITVLYWKCKGLQYEQIRIKLGYSKEWVQLQMSTVYSKLGFDKEMHWTKRVEILEKEICPLLPKDLRDWQPELPDATEEPKTQPKADPEMMALVLLDEKQVEATKNASVIPPVKETIVIQGQPSKGVRLFRRILFAIVSLVIVLVVGYFAYTFGRGATPTPEIVVVTTTPLPETETLVSSAVPVNTETPLPTLTFTPEPTFTQIPSAIAFVPPDDGIMFEDTFDSEISAAWTQSFGTWLVVDGRATILPNEDVYSDEYQLLTLESLGWNNYIVSVDLLVPSTNSNDETTVIVRTSGSKEIGFSTNWEPTIALAFVGIGYNDAERIASERDAVDFPEGISTRIEIEVQNDTYVLRLNGRELQRITLTGYNQSLVQLGAYCQSSYIGCPSFDNVKITYLP